MPGTPSERAALWRELFTVMLRTFNEVEGDIKRSADLTLIDMGCLFALGSAGSAGRSMGSLARLWGVDPSVITYRARRLEARGLIDRGGRPVNNRFVHLRITDAGRATLAEARKHLLRSADRHFFDHLEDDDMAGLRDAVARLAAATPNGRPVGLTKAAARAGRTAACGPGAAAPESTRT